MYELFFSSQQPMAKDFRRHCFNVLFPHVRQQLSDKSHAMEIEGLTNRVQAVEITNEAHQQAIEEKDATTALLNGDLKNCKYEKVGQQGEISSKDQQIAALQKRYVGYLSHEDKNNGIRASQRTMMKQSIHIYLYVDSMVIEGTRLGCC